MTAPNTIAFEQLDARYRWACEAHDYDAHPGAKAGTKVGAV
ncbi:hypothetical protein [Planktotalea arctica]|nr:hypothetical protein [Planktotalea arctica]